jgi:hypothetical protein
MLVTCSCGKTLKVRDELAGKRVKCPGCGQAILVEEEAARPTERKPARARDADREAAGPRRRPKRDEPPDEEEEAPPRRRKGARPEGSRAVLWFILVGVLVVAAGVGALVFFLVGGKPKLTEEDARARIAKLGGKVLGKTPNGLLRVGLPVAEAKVTDDDLAGLAGLTDYLGEIGLHGQKVTDAGLAHLKGLTKMRQMDLSATPITDAGLAHFTGMKDLESLTLYETAVGDDGLEHLSGLTNLQTLHLMKTNVSDKGLQHLHGLPNLKWLNVQGTRVTDAGVRELQQARPGLQVLR